MVMGHVRSVIESIIPHDSPERFRGMGADVRFGSPRFLSPYEIALNGETVSAAHIVLSMGVSRPFLQSQGLPIRST
jgi:hypothetical protein